MPETTRTTAASAGRFIASFAVANLTFSVMWIGLLSPWDGVSASLAATILTYATVGGILIWPVVFMWMLITFVFYAGMLIYSGATPDVTVSLEAHIFLWIALAIMLVGVRFGANPGNGKSSAARSKHWFAPIAIGISVTFVAFSGAASFGLYTGGATTPIITQPSQIAFIAVFSALVFYAYSILGYDLTDVVGRISGSWLDVLPALGRVKSVVGVLAIGYIFIMMLFASIYGMLGMPEHFQADSPATYTCAILDKTATCKPDEAAIEKHAAKPPPMQWIFLSFGIMSTLTFKNPSPVSAWAQIVVMTHSMLTLFWTAVVAVKALDTSKPPGAPSGSSGHRTEDAP